jgi:hypothetical protein
VVSKIGALHSYLAIRSLFVGGLFFVTLIMCRIDRLEQQLATQLTGL